MKFAEAEAALIDGKKVRCVSWPTGVWLQVLDGAFHLCYRNGTKKPVINGRIALPLDDEWEIAEGVGAEIDEVESFGLLAEDWEVIEDGGAEEKTNPRP